MSAKHGAKGREVPSDAEIDRVCEDMRKCVERIYVSLGRRVVTDPYKLHKNTYLAL